MKIISTLLVSLFSLLAVATTNNYEKAMLENLSAMQTARTDAEWQEISNKFSRIADAEQDQWLPSYYAAYCNIIMTTFKEEPDQKDQQLDLAQGHLDKALDIGGENSELLALQGFVHMIRLTVDPAGRGPSYSEMSMQAFGKARALNPENPRAIYLSAQMQMGTAQFFGTGIEEACKQLQLALEKFQEEKPQDPLAPAWGYRQAQQITQACQ